MKEYSKRAKDEESRVDGRRNIKGVKVREKEWGSVREKR